MAISLPGGNSTSARSFRANDRWKNRWTTWVLLSTIAGAAVHLTVFILLPAWEIVARSTPSQFEFVQIDPLMSVGAEVATGDEAVAATPQVDNLEIEVRQGGEGGDVEEMLTNLLEIFGMPQPSVVYPIMPRAAFGDAPPPAPPLSLDEVEPLSPDLALIGPSIQLPVIRNPTVLQRYLRTHYNPVFQSPDGNGYVSVAMWINERGAVEWTAISESSGWDRVDEIALGAFTEVALFTPARSQGMRVPVSVVISVPFTARW
jgi:TonB family protein